MPLEKITQVTGTAVCFDGDDVDTDRIIPARFMKCVTFDGLGEYLFHDVRFDANGKPKGHMIDEPARKGATILVAGHNFGCGSSREHAPQALCKFGIRAVVAGSFAEIFFGNATTLGMPCVSLSSADLQRLAAAVRADPELQVTVDLEAKQVSWAGEKDGKKIGENARGEIKEGARQALTGGQWDPISLLLDGKGEVAKLEAALPYRW